VEIGVYTVNRLYGPIDLILGSSLAYFRENGKNEF